MIQRSWKLQRHMSQSSNRTRQYLNEIKEQLSTWYDQWQQHWCINGCTWQLCLHSQLTMVATTSVITMLYAHAMRVFYCSRDCHAGDAGLPGTLRAYDMSWLRLHRSESARYSPSYTFGDDGFVRRFYSETKLPCGGRQVSAWKISTGRVVPDQQVRLVYRARQGADTLRGTHESTGYLWAWQSVLVRCLPSGDGRLHPLRLGVATTQTKDQPDPWTPGNQQPAGIRGDGDKHLAVLPRVGRRRTLHHHHW